MGLLALHRRISLQRRRQILGQNASAKKRKSSPCQHDSDGDSQAKIMRCSIPDLPEVVSTPMLPSKFLYLKHLTIDLWLNFSLSSYDYFSLVSFLDASPSLETLELNVDQLPKEHESVAVGRSSHLRQMPEHRHCSLKGVKIEGFSSAKGMVELACYILENAVSLECMELDTIFGHRRCYGNKHTRCLPKGTGILEEAARAVTAIRE